MNTALANTTQQKTQQLVNHVLQLTYGDHLTHTEIQSIIGERYGTTRYSSIVAASRRKLTEYGKMLVSVRKIGYRVAEPGEYTTVAVSHVKSAGRALNRSKRILVSAPVNDMTDPERRAHQNVSDRMALLEASFSGATAEVIKLGNKKNPLYPHT